MFEGNQLAASVLTVLVAAAVCALMIFARERRDVPRGLGYVVLCGCAALAMASWIRFGQFHTIYVDAHHGEFGSKRSKIEQHRPLHFHEIFHYYLGSKYFREIGYLGLYDCTVLADQEIAREERVSPHITTPYVRDLEDVLNDKKATDALDHCRNDIRPNFSDDRWTSFKDDIRELQRLVPDDWWNAAVYDAGFNPPPSWAVIGSAFSNVIPLRRGTLPTYLVVTSLDILLLVAAFVTLRAAFGKTTAVLAATFFGATFITAYGWNGGGFLRFTWVVALVLGLVALRRGRWVLAGALLGMSACDRIFPAGFAVGAAVPIAYRALKDREQRRILLRMGMGFAGVVVVLVVASSLLFGPSSWSTFFTRILRHGDVYYVDHIGLKKVLVWRSWVPNQNFWLHEGLIRFKNWNLALRDTWAAERPLALALQLLGAGGAVAASLKRRPYEAALLCGIVFMFVFSLPANYYYCVLALVPAFLFRRAATAPTLEARLREYGLLTAFNVFWMLTLIASRVWDDDIVQDYWICLALSLFLLLWIVAWLEPRWLKVGMRQVGRQLGRRDVSTATPP
jgi:hypothetical protein